MVSNKTKISMVFWTHFTVAVISHVSVVLILGGILKLLVSQTSLGFWEKGLLLGITFYTSMYAINHVTDQGGFCLLTDLENHFRKLDGSPEIGKFTPRFYSKCGSILESISNIFRRK